MQESRNSNIYKVFGYKYIMVFPIKEPVPVIIEAETRDNIARLKAKRYMNCKNMDTVIDNLYNYYMENKIGVKRG